MNETLRHRGPDDEGFFVGGNIGMGHRRLSIIDTSEGGRQPIANETGSVVVVFNGEIYNFLDLKALLQAEGHSFQTQTDTEVLVHAYERWGEEFLTHLDGMFSLAIYDQDRRELILAKDPFGKKPLYYASVEGALLFASEIKALLAHPGFKAELDVKAIGKYLACDYIPSPWTAFHRCQKLRAGNYLKLKTHDSEPWPDPIPYWNLEYEPKLKISEEDAAEELVLLLREAVGKRLMSDVPLGVFLSGGIDSSSIVAMMTRLKPSREIKTFCIGFGERSFDESSYAREVASFFGTDHHERVLHPEAAHESIPAILEKLDEPFADPSILPTYLLCKFTREFVTVALGGDGGDEILAGYDPFAAHHFMDLIGPFSPALAWFLEKISRFIPKSDTNMSLDFKVQYFLKGLKSYARGNPELRNSLWLAPFEPEIQRELMANSDTADWNEIFSETLFHRERSEASEPVDRVVDTFTKLYLHDDILVKVDRASMMHSLEVRVPFLDKNLVSFVARLPGWMKMKGFTRKYLLKKAMKRELPPRISKRRKKGFGVPIGKWFRGPLRELLHDTLASGRIRQDGIFHASYVERLLKEHQSGLRDHRKQLWSLLLFQLWRRRIGA